MSDENQPNISPQGIPIARTIPLRGIARITAKHMLKSHQEIAEVSGAWEVDFTALLAFRKQLLSDLKDQPGLDVHISITHLMIKATAQALQEHPLLNSTLTEMGGRRPSEIQILDEINISLAVALENGLLMTPVIRHADRKSLVEVAQEAARLVKKARAGQIELEDVMGGTFTFSNYGIVGGDVAKPIVNLPQSAILGLGRIVPKPVVVEGEIVIRSMAWLSMTCDHRIINGLQAAFFSRTLEELINDPSRLELGL